MTARTFLRRSHRAAATLAAAGLLLSACGTAHSGTAIPDGDAVAKYVGAKFEGTMNALQNKIGHQQNVKLETSRYFRIGDKWIDNTVTAARTSNPTVRATHLQSNKRRDVQFDTFVPAGGKVEYFYLGPAYKSLARTPWVSIPDDPGSSPPCAWAGIIVACRMADAVAHSYNKDPGSTLIGAKSMPDGSMTLSAYVPFDHFLEARVEPLPDKILALVPDELRPEPIKTTINIGADGEPQAMKMQAKFGKGKSRVEIEIDFKVLRKATKRDFPQIPKKSDVTKLTKQDEIEDFWDRKTKLDGG